jgi:DnaJ-class molecular chaperone
VEEKKVEKKKVEVVCSSCKGSGWEVRGEIICKKCKGTGRN